MIPRPVILWALLTAPPTSLAAQLITIRTLPVSQSDQFAFFPSFNLGMAGVSIALADSLLDPFSNPAKATRVRVAQLVGSPMSYSVTGGAGAGRTLPLGTFTRAGNWFGGAWLALQQVDAARQTQTFGPVPLSEDIVDPTATASSLRR
jgi:hypothetical protein